MSFKKTKYDSLLVGKMPKGCSLCVNGKKLVLFVTGICPNDCLYCPLSEKKKNKDVIFADEMPVKKDLEIIDEAKLIDAEGAGITGGDPIARIDRTERYIKLLKRKMGREFHIHLYTSLEIITEKKLKRLYDVGLDEIRFHMQYNDKDIWDRLEIAKKFNWKVGVEIPSIPNKISETKELIDYIAGKIDFLNLNELEVNEDDIDWFKTQGFKTKNELSYAVDGSEKAAKELMRYASKKGIKNIHFCMTRTKDTHQMGNRIKRRAKNVSKTFDKITKEGMLIRGAIFCGKGQRIWKKKLADLISLFKRQYKIERKMFYFDEKNKRLLTSVQIVKEHRDFLKQRGFRPATIEEYPTWDNFPIEVDYL